jgi:hypothetical protein
MVPLLASDTFESLAEASKVGKFEEEDSQAAQQNVDPEMQ